QAGAQAQEQQRAAGDQGDGSAGGGQAAGGVVLVAGERLERRRCDRDRIVRVDDGRPLVPDVDGQPGRGGERHGGGVTTGHLHVERLPGAGGEGERGVLGGRIVDDDREGVAAEA